MIHSEIPQYIVLNLTAAMKTLSTTSPHEEKDNDQSNNDYFQVQYSLHTLKHTIEFNNNIAG
jgi:hypothetical protein